MMPARFAPASVASTRTSRGDVVLRSPMPLARYARCIGDLLVDWSARTPEQTFLAERAAVDSGWRRTSYSEAYAQVRSIAQGLLDRGLSPDHPDRPVMLLSDNAVDHALVQLAAMHLGVPAAPISPAWSLLSQDFVKLREIARHLHPGVIYASDGEQFARAIDALGFSRDDVPVIVSAHPRRGDVLLDDLRSTRPGNEVDRAFERLGPDTIAKILFTSGSTGSPKGVVNTQRMMCSNQQAIAQLWPFLGDRPPVVVDWLPWSHTFGGNHNFNMILRNGGALYVDDGKPTPALIGRSVRNLRDVSPTLYFNVPRGFDALLPFLESDADLRAAFFRELDLVFYAAAALPQHLWERLERVSIVARGSRVTMVSAWGSTETAPLATSVHFAIGRAGVIGLPPPGTDIKLARPSPESDKLEIRVKGPNVTPGYWHRGGDVRPAALDEDGFLPTGDAARLEDPADPAKGIVFDGRIAENFKLGSGTWVTVGELRVGVIAACAPLVSDAVICGHDRDEVGALLFPNAAACGAMAERTTGSLAESLVDPRVRARVVQGLRGWNATRVGSSGRVRRVLFLLDPPSIDAGEITDKGYVNQRAVLDRRADQVERLYSDPADPAVVVIDG